MLGVTVTLGVKGGDLRMAAVGVAAGGAVEAGLWRCWYFALDEPCDVEPVVTPGMLMLMPMPMPLISSAGLICCCMLTTGGVVILRSIGGGVILPGGGVCRFGGGVIWASGGSSMIPLVSCCSLAREQPCNPCRV